MTKCIVGGTSFVYVLLIEHFQPVERNSKGNSLNHKSESYDRGGAMGAKLSYPTVDLSDRVVLVTGANSGIGYATAKVIATMGAHTIIACRSRRRAQDVSCKRASLRYLSLNM